jgi:hypothetical protein
MAVPGSDEYAGRYGQSDEWLSAAKALHAAWQRQRRSDTNPIGSDKAPRPAAVALNALGPLFFQLAYQIATLRQINC